MPQANKPVKKPVAKFRAGAMQTSVWENKGKRSDDTEFTFYTIQLQRSYLDAEQNWKNETINLRKNDVANAKLVMDKAHESIVLSSDADEEVEE